MRFPGHQPRGANPLLLFRYENMGDTLATEIKMVARLISPREELIEEKTLGLLFPHGNGHDTVQFPNCWQHREGSPPATATYTADYEITLTYRSMGTPTRKTVLSGTIWWDDGFYGSYRHASAS